ncbi:MAG: M23 family metallopeptidase [Actinomycetota bacterium]
MRRTLTGIAIALCATAVTPTTGAFAATNPPAAPEVHSIAFPVRQEVWYQDDFAGVRDHHGTDLMGDKLDHLLAADSGRIAWVRIGTPRAGNMLSLVADDGWEYWYIHINNDTPGSDDGANPAKWRFAPGIAPGVRVTRGQFIAYLGDSGESETTDPHLHFEMHRPDGRYINPYASLRRAEASATRGLCPAPVNPPAKPDPTTSPGYWTLGPSGRVMPFGGAAHLGDGPRPTTDDNPYLALTAAPDGAGYWLLRAKGGVRAFGSVAPRGDVFGRSLAAPLVGMVATPTGKGYWLFARDGGIFTFGDAPFLGSGAGSKGTAPFTAMAPSPSGQGYWLIDTTGKVLAFGDAAAAPSADGRAPKGNVVGFAPTPSGKGYWILTRDGRVYIYGDARWRGSIPGLGGCPLPDSSGITATASGAGYWITLVSGRVVALGDAPGWGSPSSAGRLALDLAALPPRPSSEG